MIKHILLILLLTPFFLKADTNGYAIFGNRPINYVIEEDFRLKNGDDFNYQHSQITAAVKYNQWFQPFIGYRVEFVKPANNWNFRQKFLLGDTSTLVKSDVYGLLNARSMFDYTISPGNVGVFRFRERFRYNTPWHLTRFKINPFIYDEIFFGIDPGQGFNQNRIGGGVDVPLAKNVVGSVYYFLQTQKTTVGDWTNTNILGIQARISF